MITRRVWILRVAVLFVIICILFIYYMSSPSQHAMKLDINSRESSNDNNIEDTSFFSRFLHREDSWNKPKVIDRMKHGHGRDPRRHLKHKVIHFDLKGMPPLIKYYEELFPLLKQVGVTGLLLEYEDMFPYTGRLKEVRNKEAYSKADIKRLNHLAKVNNLQVIPLVQTFGHLEFILKLEKFMGFREVPRFPQVICPTNNGTFDIIREMIDQVLSLHPGIKYLHIGSDEVYHIGQCPLCIDRMSKYRTTAVDLFLEHVTKVAQYVRDSAVTPIMWDDEFRTLDESLIVKSGLGSLVEIVVWDYDYNIKIQPQVWVKYAQIFQSIWIGSAFKGADRPDSIIVNETMYLANHYSWVKTMEEQESHVSFQKIILTGWQRFDHFAVPCELFPLAIPSLISCMTFLNNNTSSLIRMEEIFANVSELLDCTPRLDFCRFPGSSIHQEIKHLHRLKMVLERVKNSSVFKGWMNKASLLIHFASPSYLDNIYFQISSLRSDLQRVETALEESLRTVYPEWSVTEWMFINFKPFSEEVETLFNGLTNVMNEKTFPVRPLSFPKNKNQDSPLPNEL